MSSCLRPASKAHTLFVQKQTELHPGKQPRELQRLSDTRWACRYTSLDTICSTYDAVLATLELIGDEAIEAAGLYHHIHNFQFIACLIIFTLREMRSDGTWDHTFEYITDVAALHGIEVEHSKRPRHSALPDDYVADSTIGQRDRLNTSVFKSECLLPSTRSHTV